MVTGTGCTGAFYHSLVNLSALPLHPALGLRARKMRPDILTPGVMEQGKELAQKWPNVIFASSGEGLGMTGVIISFHKDCSEYHRRLNLLRLDWKDLMEDIQSFVVSPREGEFKRFSLTYLSGVPL